MDSPNKSRGSILAVLVRIYVVIGTSLYFLLFRIEGLIARLGNNSQFPILNTFTAEKWQVRSVRLTLAFPVMFPVILIRDLLLLIYALIAVGFRYVASLLRRVVSKTAQASKPLADRTGSTVQTIWEETTQPAEDSLPVSLPDMADVRESVVEVGGRVRNTFGAFGKRLSSGASAVGKRASNVIDAARGHPVGAMTEKSDVADTTESVKETALPPKQELDSSAVAINIATLRQLTALPGIGEALAQRIIDYRQEHGRFKDSDALTAVSGVGPNLLEKLKGKIVFD